MAVTSIWRVKGWLGKVVVYVENPDKTTNPSYYEKEDMTDRECQELNDVIAYAINSDKTQQIDTEEEIVERFISGVNCHPATARTEMMAVKKRFGKEDGTVAYHGYQSFAPGEATPEIAHRIGVELAQRLWGDRYQVVVATHLDKENHLHNHFVLNTVSRTTMKCGGYRTSCAGSMACLLSRTPNPENPSSMANGKPSRNSVPLGGDLSVVI